MAKSSSSTASKIKKSSRRDSSSSSSRRQHDESGRRSSSQSESRRGDDSRRESELSSSESEGEANFKEEVFDMMIDVQRKLSALTEKMDQDKRDVLEQVADLNVALVATTSREATPRAKTQRRSRAFGSTSPPAVDEGDGSSSPQEVLTPFGRWTR